MTSVGLNTRMLDLRVLDLSMGWAGPLVSEMLAEMGAEVIKVEDTKRFDWWRGSQALVRPKLNHWKGRLGTTR
jgi:crotonobetainyl-CoA:carnitine CoA-transferase CaiB-like acyl-CoA transferase